MDRPVPTAHGEHSEAQAKSLLEERLTADGWPRSRPSPSLYLDVSVSSCFLVRFKGKPQENRSHLTGSARAHPLPCSLGARHSRPGQWASGPASAVPPVSFREREKKANAFWAEIKRSKTRKPPENTSRCWSMLPQLRGKPFGGCPIFDHRSHFGYGSTSKHQESDKGEKKSLAPFTRASILWLPTSF